MTSIKDSFDLTIKEKILYAAIAIFLIVVVILPLSIFWFEFIIDLGNGFFHGIDVAQQFATNIMDGYPELLSIQVCILIILSVTISISIVYDYKQNKKKKELNTE